MGNTWKMIDSTRVFTSNTYHAKFFDTNFSIDTLLFGVLFTGCHFLDNRHFVTTFSSFIPFKNNAFWR